LGHRLAGQTDPLSVLAEESLSRLETGAATNPSWKTLAAYAAAVGLAPVLTARPLDG
jgi:hypothetical protein